MGSVRGDLDVLGIANLLQVLTMNQAEGYLTVTRDSERKVVQFGPAGIRLLSGAMSVSPLGEILLRSQRITRDQLAEILSGQRHSGMPFGEYVTQKGILTQEAIDSALREQVADEICDLFTWTHGSFEYADVGHATPPPEEGLLSTVVLGQNVMSIALEAARRMDQMARIRAVIPDERLVPVLLELPAPLGEPEIPQESLEEVLPHVDGKRSVAQIIEASLYPRFTVLLTLYALAQRGAIKVRDAGAPGGPETVNLGWTSETDRSPAPPHSKVLLMSDFTNSRLSISMCLRNLGFEVVECQTLVNPRELLSEIPAQAIILDIAIETDEGLNTCTRLSQSTSLPFIVVTANSGRLATANARKSGARHVLLKPIHPDLLLDRLHDVLAGEKQQQA
jgi:CheY-like chemotaxis protein